MAIKYEMISELYRRTGAGASGSPEAWQAFLSSACRNYKCRFDEQMLIYAQRPDATAVLEIEKWNEKFHRYVRRGSKGIAVFATADNDKTKLKYYFDVSDTEPSYRGGMPVPIWQMSERYETAVIERLSDRFGSAGRKALDDALTDTTKTAVEDNLPDYLGQLADVVEGSYLEAFDEENIGEKYRRLVTNSVNFMLFRRCGLPTDGTFEREDFADIVNFNTPETLTSVGIATSDIAESVLREISQTIRDVQIAEKTEKNMSSTFAQPEKREYDRRERQTDIPERSNDHERNHLHDAEGLPASRPRITAAARSSAWQILPPAEGVSGEAQTSDLRQSPDVGQADGASVSDRAGSNAPVRATDEAARTGAGRDGGTESQRPDDVDRTHEQHSPAGGGSDSQRADLQLNENDGGSLPTVAEQIERIAEAEDAQSSAFVLSQEDIDEALRVGSLFSESKFRIYRQFQDGKTGQEIITFLKKEYGIGGHSYSYTFSDGSNGFISHDGKGFSFDHLSNSSIPSVKVPWSKAEKRLRELIENDRYLTPEEKQRYPDYLLSVQARETAQREKREREKFIQSSFDTPNAEKRDSLPQRLAYFIGDLDRFEKDYLTEAGLPEITHSDAALVEGLIGNPDSAQQLLDGLKKVQGGTADGFHRNVAWRLCQELNDLFPTDYRFNVGDTLYLGVDEYHITGVQDGIVSLTNPKFPLFGKEMSIDELSAKLSLSDANDHLKAFVSPAKTEEKPNYTSTVEAVYPAVENGLPYDVVIEKLHIDEPEQTVSEEQPVISPSEPTPEKHNFRITDDALGVGGAKEKFQNNLAAIHLLHKLQEENRQATPEEQEILSKYVGWGGLSMAFDEQNASWTNEYAELKAALNPAEYMAAMESTLTAFYTPPVVIKAMYGVLEKLGFSQGNILEPSCGVGNFFGLLPESMAQSKLYGVELDPLTGGIAKQLYQNANIAVEGFEQTNLPDGHFDVILGNVPFGDYRLDDKRYNAQNFMIHDYFFAKALDKVRPGGVVMFITSKGTMDKANNEVRKYIAQRAELLGAIRLPDTTFKANAGTEVTSDIIILQKRDRVIDIEPDWIFLENNPDGIVINDYFVEHPDMICGEMRVEQNRFGKLEAVCKPFSDMPLEASLEYAASFIKGSIPEREPIAIDEVSDAVQETVEADPAVRNFSYAVMDGKIYFRENNVMVPADVSVTAENRIKGLIDIRDCARRLIEYQSLDYSDDIVKGEQEKLNLLYDRFTEKYGLINSRGNYLAFSQDESYFLLCSLEVLDDDGNFKRKADMFSKRTIKPHHEITSVETSSEGLAVSIGEKACVDLPYMAQLTGKSEEEIIGELRGVIYREPNTDPPRYVPADEYLSGNVRQKLQIAELAAKSDSEFQANVEALKQVIPKDLTAAEINVRLGVTWIPPQDIKRFILDTFSPSFYAAREIKVRLSLFSGEWFIENKSADNMNIIAFNSLGTERASAYRLLEDALNLKETRIYDYIVESDGSKKAVFNAKETMAAQAKQELIKQAFKDWIWKDPERRERLTRYYNDTFNNVRPREYDGSHIHFVGMNPEITLRPHQVNAIAHILYGGNTLLAHKVGAGKTFEMIAAAQESKRLGLCHKAMFVVPNHLVGQWASEYLRLYPSANILVTTKQDFEKSKRKKFCGRIATGDYDAVIIGHSQFEKIPMSMERQLAQLQDQLDEIQQGIEEAQARKGDRYTVKELMRMRKGVEAKLKKLNDTSRKDTMINFEELGVDMLFVDESHLYKNLYLYTKMRNVGGVAQTEAQKSSDLFMKCRYLDEITGGRGIVFATGTPISNSMVEMYSIQRYLQYGTLTQRGLQHFDAWASTFGETVAALELAPEGTNYRLKTRFSRFYNLPELMQMFREVADIQTADMLKLPVPKVNYHNIKTPPSDIQIEMVEGLATRAEKVRSGAVDPHLDNMLAITNDGRKLALDQRMLNPMLPDDPNSKVNACVENVYRIWEEHADTKAAQLIFCDLSTPKNDGSFNVYDDIRAKLIRMGIPEEQIRFIHEADSDAQKKELFGKVRSGEVRILLGSTQKMGAGTNVQDRLIAMHNLDCPWRPSDLERAPVKAA